jgi:GWxTD domain-containing protein
MTARRGAVGRCWPVWALLIALVPAPVLAQRQPDRVATFHLRDSLKSSADTAKLLALESRIIDSARTHRDDPLIHLRLGFLGLRLAELTGGAGHFRDAEGEFEWATGLQPKWPLGWYGLGNAELIEADLFPVAMRGLFAALGRDVFDAPAHDLARSALVDSTFVYGVVELADDALHLGLASHLTTALIALREVGRAPAGHHPSVLLLRGRIEREVGDVDSAVAAFQALLNRNHFDATALLEMARTKLAAGRISGVDQWYLGLSLADSATAATYHRDLALVMSDSALRTFDAARGEARVAVARRFWDTRDPDAFNGSAERLREHYRRIEVAHREYPLVPPGHRYDTLKAFGPTGSLFDDRGRIYVRHGEPDDRTSFAMTGIPPNESWLYRRPAGDLLFNFAQPDTAQGFRMYESLLDIVGLGTAAQRTGQGDVRARLEGGDVMATYGAAWTAQAAQEMLYSRQKLSPVYGKMLSAGERGAREMQVAERAAGRQSIAIGLQTDSWKFGYELPLTADIDVVAVGSDSAGTQMQVVFAIPGSSLYAPPSMGRAIYPIRMRVAVRNAAGEVVQALDTLRSFAANAPIPETGNLLGRLPIHIPPGNYTVRVALETESRGLVTKPQPVHVAALTATTIELSDLALGARTVPLPWRTGPADTAWINPLHRFGTGEPMQLFFQVGGLAAGTAYRVQYAVLKPGHTDALLQVGYIVIASETPDRVHREIDIGRVGSGDYVLQVTVSTPSGGKVVRQRRFTVVK